MGEEGEFFEGVRVRGVAWGFGEKRNVDSAGGAGDEGEGQFGSAGNGLEQGDGFGVVSREDAEPEDGCGG